MKKRVIVSIITFLVLMTLIGCGKTAENGGSLPDVDQTILNTKTVWDNNDNLYEIPLEVLKDMEQAQVYRVDDDLLFGFNAYSEEKQKSVYVLQLVSLKNGEVLFEQKLDSLTYSEIQVLDNHVAVNDLAEGKSYLFNKKLEPVKVYEVPQGMFCLDTKGENVYRFTYGQGIEVTNLANGETSYILENADNLFCNEMVGNVATFIYTDKDTLMRKSGVLNLSTGEITNIETPVALNSMEVCGNTWVGATERMAPFYLLSDGNNQSVFYCHFNFEISMHHESGHVMCYKMSGTGDNYYMVYDNQGNLLSACIPNGLTLFEKMDFAWFEEYNGYIFVMNDENEQNHLMFWDISGDIIENDLDLESVEEYINMPDGTEVSQYLFDKAEVLSEKYGVEILIADQCDTFYSDHTTEWLLDEKAIDQALDTLDYVFGRYPEGFFKQLPYHTYSEVEVQLVSTLKKSTSTDEITYVSGGFVSTNNPEKILVALDCNMVNSEEEINTILESTLYHEISHVIDRRLEFAAQYRPQQVYSEEGWLALNPEGFAYNDTYYGTLDPKYQNYFMNHYSCTNSTEDRACLMEAAAMGDVGTFTGREGLIEKLAYYSEGIRDGFDTTGWPEILPWEETLKKVRGN